jgi:hypothetical protein
VYLATLVAIEQNHGSLDILEVLYYLPSTLTYLYLHVLTPTDVG